MKKIINKSAYLLIIAIAHFLISSSIFAQAPQKMSFQAVIRNGSDSLVCSSPVGIQVSVLQGSSSGTAVYVENHTANTNANGLVSLEIGAGNATVGTFGGINWASGPYYIKTGTDLLGGSNYTLFSSSELMSVPYALFSANSTPGPQGPAGNDGATGPAGPQGPAGSFPPGAVAGEMNYWNGTAWVTVAPGISLPGNQALTLSLCNGVPTWGPCPAVLPSVSTAAVSSIANLSATSVGTVSNDGGAAVTARGVCWSTTANPTTANSYTTDGSGTGSFTSNLSGLTQNTTYYVRAYATNSVGTAYGNEVSFTTANNVLYTIGQSYQGGIVAYILQAGDPGYDASVQHGLIAAPSDQGIAQWGCYGAAISGADGTAIGTGAQNTIDIMNGCSTAGIAARLCGDLVLGGYSDWYLPSRDELNQLYVNRVAIGGFAYNLYWSSTEFNSYDAWLQSFGPGGQGNGNRSDGNGVRAVRAF